MSDPDKLIFGFHEDTLLVNRPDSLMPLRHQSELHFSIINITPGSIIEFDDSVSSKIELRVNVGEGSGNMFTGRDAAGYGTIKCSPGFKATSWDLHPIKKNLLVCTIVPVTGSVVRLEPSSSISFVWSDITSTAPEGYSSMTATLTNILGVQKTVLSCPIYKKLTGLDIMQFYASPSTGAAGQKITLNWSVESADRGTLLPGGYDIMGPDPRRTSAKDVVLEDRVDCYYLNLVDRNSGAFQRANIFTMPPVISDLEINKGQIVWESHFATQVELGQDGVYETVNKTGTKPMKPDIKTVSLRCSGLFSVERHLAVVSIQEISHFYLETCRFDNHMAVVLNWSTVGLAALAIKAWDTEAYTISNVPEGSWEHVYPPKANLQYVMEYTRADGSTGAIRIRKGV